MKTKIIIAFSTLFMLLNTPVALKAKRIAYKKVAVNVKPQLCRYNYTGQEQEGELKNKKGIYNYRARVYDAKLRRFLSFDKAKQMYGAYNFCLGNPINYKDKNGQWAVPAGKKIKGLPDDTYIYRGDLYTSVGGKFQNEIGNPDTEEGFVITDKSNITRNWQYEILRSGSGTSKDPYRYEAYNGVAFGMGLAEWGTTIFGAIATLAGSAVGVVSYIHYSSLYKKMYSIKNDNNTGKLLKDAKLKLARNHRRVVRLGGTAIGIITMGAAGVLAGLAAENPDNSLIYLAAGGNLLVLGGVCTWHGIKEETRYSVLKSKLSKLSQLNYTNLLEEVISSQGKRIGCLEEGQNSSSPKKGVSTQGDQFNSPLWKQQHEVGNLYKEFEDDSSSY